MYKTLGKIVSQRHMRIELLELPLDSLLLASICQLGGYPNVKKKHFVRVDGVVSSPLQDQIIHFLFPLISCCHQRKLEDTKGDIRK